MLDRNNVLLAMLFLRILSGVIEVGAGFIMYYLNSVKKAMQINALLGFLGPAVLILITFLGLVEISSSINLKKLVLVALGVILIIIGTGSS
ncbi:MAG: DUF2619 domain-containing protein [Halanaerobiales bacterium]